MTGTVTKLRPADDLLALGVEELLLRAKRINPTTPATPISRTRTDDERQSGPDALAARYRNHTGGSLRSGGLKEQEEDLQREIINALEGIGYETLVVGDDKHFGSLIGRVCGVLKKFGASEAMIESVLSVIRMTGAPNDKGYPDLSVRRSTWPPGVAMLMEVKTQTGRLSTEQATLHARGWSVVVRSAANAVEAARGFGDWLEAGRE